MAMKRSRRLGTEDASKSPKHHHVVSVSLGDRQITALHAMGKAFAGSRISLSEIVRVAIDDLIEKLRDMDNDAGVDAGIAYVLRRGREDRIFMQPSAPETGD